MMHSFFLAAVDPSLGCNSLVENVRSAPSTVDFAIDLTTINVQSEVALPPYGAYAYQYMFNSQQAPLFTTPRGLRSDIFYYATKKCGLEAAESRNPAPSRVIPSIMRAIWTSSLGDQAEPRSHPCVTHAAHLLQALHPDATTLRPGVSRAAGLKTLRPDVAQPVGLQASIP